jgi:hypothetical protein
LEDSGWMSVERYAPEFASTGGSDDEVPREPGVYAG